MVEIQFYRTADGKCPVERFLDALQSKQAAKVYWTLRAVKSLDPVPVQYMQKLTHTDDLWEVRVIFSSDIFRLLGFFSREGRLVLCHGFAKKTQKTPLQEIATAEARKTDYEKRHHE